MNNIIKIGVTGRILEETYKDWYIRIEDDKESTGGYLILLFNQSDPLRSSEGYDYWAENMDELKQMIKEAKWDIGWFIGDVNTINS